MFRYMLQQSCLSFILPEYNVKENIAINSQFIGIERVVVSLCILKPEFLHNISMLLDIGCKKLLVMPT